MAINKNDIEIFWIENTPLFRLEYTKELGKIYLLEENIVVQRRIMNTSDDNIIDYLREKLIADIEKQRRVINLITKIRESRIKCAKSMHVYPDYVMINIDHKEYIISELNVLDGQNMAELVKFEGMKVIWTPSIGIDEVICSYNPYK